MNKVKIFGGLFISLIFLYLSLKGIEWNQVAHIILKANYLFIIPGIILHFISFYVRSLKWAMITSKVKKVSSFGLFPLIALGLAMNNILPLRAGEFGRIVMLSNKYGISKINAGITIVVERLFDIIGLLLVTVLFIHFRQWPSYINSLINASTFFVLAFIVLTPILLYFSKSILGHSIFTKIKGDVIFSIISKKIADIKNGYFIYHDAGLITKLTLLSIVLWIIEGLSYYILSFVFNLHISLFDFIFVCSVVNLSSAIPSSPGFIGTFEFFATNLLVFLGISRNLSLSYVLILHVELLLPITIVGIYFYFAKHYYNYIGINNIKQIEHGKYNINIS